MPTPAPPMHGRLKPYYKRKRKRKNKWVIVWTTSNPTN